MFYDSINLAVNQLMTVKRISPLNTEHKEETLTSSIERSSCEACWHPKNTASLLLSNIFRSLRNIPAFRRSVTLLNLKWEKIA